MLLKTYSEKERSKEYTYSMHIILWQTWRCNLRTDILWGSYTLLQMNNNFTRSTSMKWLIWSQLSRQSLLNSMSCRINSVCQEFLQLLWPLDVQQTCPRNWMIFLKQPSLVKQHSAKCSSNWLRRLTRSMKCSHSFATKTMCLRMCLHCHRSKTSETLSTNMYSKD